MCLVSVLCMGDRDNGRHLRSRVSTIALAATVIAKRLQAAYDTQYLHCASRTATSVSDGPIKEKLSEGLRLGGRVLLSYYL